MHATKLLFLLGATSGVFIITHHKQDITLIPADGDADILVIDEDTSGKAYGAFIQHVMNKSPRTTDVGEIREMWANWAEDNVTPTGKLRDDYYIPETHILSYTSWINLGIDQEHSDGLWELVKSTIEETPVQERHTSSIISKVSKFADSHAELAILSAMTEAQMHVIKNEQPPSEAAITDAELEDEDIAKAQASNIGD